MAGALIARSLLRLDPALGPATCVGAPTDVRTISSPRRRAVGKEATRMEWYRRVQFVAAVPMPPEMADEFGTTVNGMWASPELGSSDEVADLHARGRRVLFSVPLIALVPREYERPDRAFLLDEVCRDVDGRESECDWYYWETKPVYAACVYSDVFRRHLLEHCRHGVDLGMDAVNLDEIMTSIGLMDREPGGTGFCSRCLERFRSSLPQDDPSGLADAADDILRKTLRDDEELFARYRGFHEREAFRVTSELIAELRAHAVSVNPGFAISANVAYLGNMVETFGALWGCLWGPHLDFVLMENDYRLARGESHTILPRGTFGPWYRLGASFKNAPGWICPSINVPRQLAGQDRRRYYELMFLEAYAHRGRWGYYWWPGVDAETRRSATAPDTLKTWIGFIDEHRELYEETTSMNDLAVLYADGPIMRRPETHVKYVALAQALEESGFQFDVGYVGDGSFNPDALDPSELSGYRAVLVPEARDLGSAPTAALEAFARAGGDVVVFSESPLDRSLVRQENGDVLEAFWRGYRDEDRDWIAGALAGFKTSRIRTPTSIRAIRYALGERQVVHLLNYAYAPETDTVTPAHDVEVSVPWSGDATSCTGIGPEGARELLCGVDGDHLVIEIPEVNLYALVVIGGAPS
jgi:hypothetical protein